MDKERIVFTHFWFKGRWLSAHVKAEEYMAVFCILPGIYAAHMNKEANPTIYKGYERELTDLEKLRLEWEEFGRKIDEMEKKEDI